MPRGITSDAIGQYGQNSQNAQSTYNTLSPLYSRMATSPQGYTQPQLNNFNTAALQSNGGAAAGAVGEGGLAAARTNNAGGFQAAIADSARLAGVNNSADALQVQNQNAQLEQQQQAQGLAGLQGLYNTASHNGLEYLNTALQGANATTSAAQGWTQLGINAATGGAGAVKGFRSNG